MKDKFIYIFCGHKSNFPKIRDGLLRRFNILKSNQIIYVEDSIRLHGVKDGVLIKTDTWTLRTYEEVELVNKCADAGGMTVLVGMSLTEMVEWLEVYLE